MIGCGPARSFRNCRPIPPRRSDAHAAAFVSSAPAADADGPQMDGRDPGRAIVKPVCPFRPAVFVEKHAVNRREPEIGLGDFWRSLALAQRARASPCSFACVQGMHRSHGWRKRCGRHFRDPTACACKLPHFSYYGTRRSMACLQHVHDMNDPPSGPPSRRLSRAESPAACKRLVNMRRVVNERALEPPPAGFCRWHTEHLPTVWTRGRFLATRPRRKSLRQSVRSSQPRG